MAAQSNYYPKFSTELGIASKKYLNSLIVLVALAGGILLLGFIVFYASLLYYIDFEINFENWIIFAFVILSGLQIFSWVKFKRFVEQLKFYCPLIPDLDFSKSVEKLKLSLSLQIARKISAIVLSFPLYCRWMEYNHGYYNSIEPGNSMSLGYYGGFVNVLILFAVIIGGLSLTGSILQAISYSKMSDWLKRTAMRFPMNYEILEMKSAIHSIYIGLILRMISPILSIGYIGIFLYLAGWITILVGFNKFTNQLKLTTSGYRINPQMTVVKNQYQSISDATNRIVDRFPRPIKPLPIQQEMQYCPNCGENLPNYVKFCTNCGNNLFR